MKIYTIKKAFTRIYLYKHLKSLQILNIAIKHLALTFIILFNFSLILFCTESTLVPKELIMPKQLTYSSLPDDYDPRIEEFFQFFSEFMAAQDPDAKFMENAKLVYEFYDKQPIERFKKLTLSRWILYNKYPYYLQEFEAINGTFFPKDRYNDTTGFFDKSLVNYYCKLKKDKHSEKDNLLSDFFAYRKYLYDRKINIQPIQYLWLVCRIHSLDYIKREDKIFLSLKLDVDRSLGGNYFQDKTIEILFPERFKDYQLIKDFYLNQDTQYLIPLFPDTRYEKFPMEYKHLQKYTFYFSTVLKINNNKISLEDDEELVDMSKMWGSLSSRHRVHYLFENKRSVTIDEADKIITDYINCKKLVE